MKKICIVLICLFITTPFVNAYIMSSLEVEYRNIATDILGQITQVQDELTAKKKAYEGSGITSSKWAAIAQPYYDRINSLTASYNWYVNQINRLAALAQDCDYKNAYYDSDLDRCICKQGYVSDMFGNSCILDIASCSDVYGAFSVDMGNNQCGCMHGYVRNDTMTQCVKLTKEVGDKQCKKEFGSNSEVATNDYSKCICKNGYQWNSIKTECVKSTVYDMDLSGGTDYINETTELVDTIQRMYNKNLTIFNDPVSFMADNGLRRDEASKFFVRYAEDILGKTPDYSKTDCKFKDLNKAWPDLKDIVVEACQLGLFQGYKGDFMPTDKLTNAQAITVFMRLIDGYKDESGDHFANEYYKKARESGLLKGLNLENRAYFDRETTRGEVAIMLYRGQNTGE